LTVSIGLATYPTHAWDKESLLREADDAVYNAKHGGKDRVRAPGHPSARVDAADSVAPSAEDPDDESTGA
ncbi:MAG: diguanylate cyclase, partial [Actinobacteria bacterium]